MQVASWEHEKDVGFAEHVYYPIDKAEQTVLLLVPYSSPTVNFSTQLSTEILFKF